MQVIIVLCFVTAEQFVLRMTFHAGVFGSFLLHVRAASPLYPIAVNCPLLSASCTEMWTLQMDLPKYSYNCGGIVHFYCYLHYFNNLLIYNVNS